MAQRQAPQVRGATVHSRRGKLGQTIYEFKRLENVTSYPRDQPGAEKHILQLPGVTGLPAKGDPKRVNILEGLELHVDTITVHEEGVLVRSGGRYRGAGGRSAELGSLHTVGLAEETPSLASHSTLAHFPP